MNTKRSYLDNLNAGRQRRSGTALDEINRTLDQLENRLERALEARDRGSAGEEDITRRMERLSDRAGLRRPTRRTPAQAERTAPDIERSRRDENGLGGIATELKTMREGLNAAMSAGIRREFDALREELARVVASAPQSPMADGLRDEFERLSKAISQLAERSDDKSVKMLRLELEQLRASLAKLAREESVRALDQRWDAFEDRLSQPDPMVERLTARLEEISAAVDNLPESLSLRSLEERLRALAGSLDQFAGQQNQPDLHAMVEERLDEISRAISASAALAHSPGFDTAVLERIEARIGSLSNQIDEVVQDRPGGMVIERLNALSERVDEVARRVEIPEQVVERLAAHIARISDRLDTIPAPQETDHLFRGLEDRFTRLTELVERRQEDAIQEGRSLFQELEQRLEDVAERLERKSAAANESGIMTAIDGRFAELAARLEGAGETGALRALEARLDDITGRLQSAAPAGSGVDAEVFRSLEAQVANLAAQLGHESADRQALAPRLENIERSIGESRTAILESARQAAAEAAEKLASAPAEAADGRLKEEIEKLHALTRKTDERNTKTFEAIHDTLLKIVDRLGALEAGAAEDVSAKITVGNPPSLAPSDEEEAEPAPRRTPAEAAAAAAEAALLDEEPEEGGEEPERRSMLSGLSRAFVGRRGSEAEEPRREEPELSVGEAEDAAPTLDPERVNEPLEPGSGAPDVNAIMRRVRDERGSREHEGDETAKADFIAAARRAAQAAAAEAEVLKDRRADTADKRRKSGLGGILGRRKLLLTLGAAIVIAGGVLFARSVLQDGGLANLLAESEATGEAAQEERDVAAEVEAPAPEPAEEALPPARVVDRQTDEDPLANIIAKAEGDSPARAATSAQPPAPPVASDVETVMPSEMTTAAVDSESEPASESEPPVEPVGLDLSDIPAAEVGPAVLREAAAEGSPEAFFEVANRYAEGRGVTVDMAQAAQWYELAAEQGLAPAQYRIGNFYEKGTGVERDISQAKIWYRRAAEQGNASAMHNLGVLYAMGAEGTASDNETAAHWFGKAAEFGVTDSQFNLGILYAKGAGVPRDLGEAYKWFNIVARKGDGDAASKRDEIAKAMAPADLARAQTNADAWQAREVEAEANMVDVPREWTQDQAKWTEDQAERTDDQTTTASIDTTRAIANIQLILNNNGYDAGPADGVMGEKTRAAIRAFQKANDMPETGEIDEALVRALLEKNESAG